MSVEDDDSTVNLVVQDEGSRIVVDFLKRDSTYDKIYKQLSKASANAVDKLEELMMTSKNEDTTYKCAKALLELLNAVSKEKTNLDLQKLILHSRQLAQGNNTKQLVEEKEQKPRVVIDFSTVKTL